MMRSEKIARNLRFQRAALFWAKAFWKFWKREWLRCAPPPLCARLLMALALLPLAGMLRAQTIDWRNTTFWSLNGGITTNDILVDGLSFGLVLDPRLSLSPRFMIGSKSMINFSTDDIIALETQAYARWNFWQLGDVQNPTNVFLQGGVGLLAAYRGADVTRTRGSILVDITGGVTIPLGSGSRWQIEPSVRIGYPFIAGAALTAGIRFPLGQRGAAQDIPPRIEYVEVVRMLPTVEIIERIVIVQVEYIIFGPDISQYNVGIDADARAVNDLVLQHTVQVLLENPDYVVRVEGHANPLTYTPSQVAGLVALSEERANEVASLLRSRGVPEGQIVVAAFGGTRMAAGDFDHRIMNRRVELIIKQIVD